MSRKINMPKRSESTEREVTDNSQKSEIDLFEISRLIVRRRRLIVLICGLVVAATTVYLLFQPNQYTSKAIILPSGSSGNYSSLKAMVGLASGIGATDDNSSALFPVIINSDLVANGVLAKPYQFKVEGQMEETTLAEYFNLNDPDKLRMALRGATTVNTDARTGEIVVAVETSYPTLSQAVLTEYLAQLESFNLHKRRSRAKENQTYLENQVAAASGQLVTAESELEVFRQANANWSTTASPKIITQSARLQREVDLRSRAYLLLQEQYEMAKFEAQKDVPIVRTLDQPSLPTQKSGPFRRNLIIMSAVVSFGLVVLMLFIIDLARQAVSGKNRAGYDQLRSDLTQAFPRSARRLSRVPSGETAMAGTGLKRELVSSALEPDN